MLNRYSRLYFAIATAAFILSGCATNQYVKLAPVDNGSQKIVFAKGKETLVSEKKHYVSLAPYKKLNDVSEHTPYLLYVDNLGNEPVRVSSKNVQVKLKGKSSNGEEWDQEIDVLSYNDLLREVEREEKNQRGEAEWAKSVPIYSDNSRNLQDATESAVSEGFRPFEAAEDQDKEIQNKVVNDKLKTTFENINRKRKFIKRFVMKPKKVAPGQAHGGLIITDTRSLGYQTEGIFEIIVSVGGEQHTFLINRTPYIDAK